MGPGHLSAFKLPPFSWSPTGRAFGPVGSLHPGATSLSPESVFLNHSRGVTGSLGHTWLMRVGQHGCENTVS